MKAKKVLKRIAKIQALISKVTERSSASAPRIREVLRDATAAVIRAKEAVQASSRTAKNLPVKHSKPTLKATPEPPKPKRKLSAAGRAAIVAASKKGWRDKKAAATKAAPVVAKKAAVKKSAAKRVSVKAAPTKAAKASAREIAKRAPVKNTAVKAPAKKTVRVVQAANTPAAPTTAATAATTPEQAVSEAPVQ